MRWSKAQESEPKPGAGMDERVAWLEKVARTSHAVSKAQNELIEAQGAMIKALEERGDKHANLLNKIDPLLRAQTNTIEALDTLVKALSGRGDEHSDRLDSIDKLLRAQGNVIKARDGMTDALSELVEGHRESVDKLLRAQEDQIKARDGLIDVLAGRAEHHGDMIRGLSDRIAKLEAQAARTQGEGS